MACPERLLFAFFPAMSSPQDPASLRASLPEGADASALILARLQAHGARHSRYQSRGEVARGGMGAILRVWDEDLRRELAMKVVLGQSGQANVGEIPPKMLGRFLEEAQVTGQLDHPGIVPVHELGLDERGAVFFTMRLVRGRDLKEIFDLVQKGDAEWTQTRVLWALLKVCDAMAYAHSKGVVHRDLKPANVMVGRFGEVYVMDWGLARVIGQPDRHDLRLRRDTSQSLVESERRADASHSADSVLFTMDGDVVGTPSYMAPEQARGEIERLGPRSDVYAVGAMLYHLLTGEMPYVAPGAQPSQHMVLRWALEGPPRPLHVIKADLPEELVAICEKAMAREPEQRYADMGALSEDLRAYLENRVVRAHRRGAWVEFVKWMQRNRALALAWSAALLVAVLGLTATAFVQIRGRRVAEDARQLAQTNERAAIKNLAEAERQRAIAQRERSNVLRLSAFQELADLEREADALWPAVPANVPALQVWMGRAERLVAGLEPGADGDPGHRRQLEELRARALTLTSAERESLLAASPRAAELRAAEAEVATLSAAAEVRAGRAQPVEFELDPELMKQPPMELNDRANPLVDPSRRSFGREAEGLALARAAVDLVASGQRFLVLDTLAWAAFACGLDEEALAASNEALKLAPAPDRRSMEEYLGQLSQAVEVARGPRGGEALAAARTRLASLELEVFGASQPRFEHEDDRWWFGQLSELVRAIEDFADPERGLLRGLSPRHGWGVARRIEFARTLEQRSREGAAAVASWGAAIARVRVNYGGLELAPQLGLVPLGPDPRSGLEEFADLATGEPPRRRDDGSLELLPASSVVFVLLPGGKSYLGAQPSDSERPNFDPAAQPDEGPVNVVELGPFLLAKYELTQGQWRRFTARAPSKYLAGTQVRGRALSELSPVERVSWFEVERELARLGWRLPTEAQWEYAARAGSETPWWPGDEPAALQGAANLADRFAQANDAPFVAFQEELDDGHLTHAPVGSFEPNAFGLHDVLGNVYEWCRDEYRADGAPTAKGEGLRTGGNSTTRVVRGGCYASLAVAARSSKRDSAGPELETETIGVRPLRPLE